MRRKSSGVKTRRNRPCDTRVIQLAPYWICRQLILKIFSTRRNWRCVSSCFDLIAIRATHGLQDCKTSHFMTWSSWNMSGRTISVLTNPKSTIFFFTNHSSQNHKHKFCKPSSFLLHWWLLSNLALDVKLEERLADWMSEAAKQSYQWGRELYGSS